MIKLQNKIISRLKCLVEEFSKSLFTVVFYTKIYLI